MSYLLIGRGQDSKLTARCGECPATSEKDKKFDGNAYAWAEMHLQKHREDNPPRSAWYQEETE